MCIGGMQDTRKEHRQQLEALELDHLSSDLRLPVSIADPGKVTPILYATPSLPIS